MKIITVTLNPAVDRTIEVESLVPGAHQIGREIFRTPGGKGVNVSRTLSAMGIASIATGFLGADNRSEFKKFLADPLVEDRFVVLPGRTRENITITDRAANVDTHIRDRGLAIGAEIAERFCAELKKICSGTMVIFSGSLPPGLSDGQFGAMIDACNECGAKVVVDTSAGALKAAAGRKLFLAKPNAEELGELMGIAVETELQLVEAGRKLCGNVENVLISRGAEGAMLVTHDNVLAASCAQYNQPVRNTVGCGDVMLGSFVGGLVKKSGIEDSLKLAVANSSACAYHLAAGEFDKKLAETFFNKIEIKKVVCDG